LASSKLIYNFNFVTFRQMKLLDLSNRGLTALALTGIDLTGVTELICNYNQLTDLSGLPNSLEELYCIYNQLTELPNLPASLKILWCRNNSLTSLPDLPISLKEFNCSDNLLTSLPVLPNSLEQLYCGFNRLTTLPDLPLSLERLHCWCNQLVNFPDLPASLEMLEYDNEEILPTLPYNLWGWGSFKLDQYNKKCTDLGLENVTTLPSEEVWDVIAKVHLIWQYRIGGEKWTKACNTLV